MDGTPAAVAPSAEGATLPPMAANSSADKPPKEPKDAKGKQRKKVRSPDLQAPQYNIRATVVRRRVTVGDQGLARLLNNSWTQIHHSIYYIAVFAPTAIGGRIVNAADVGIREYIQERLDAAERLLKEVQTQAHDLAIEMGEPGQTTEHLVEVSSQVETHVLQMLRTYDDYLVVVDSLWIGGEMLDEKRNAAHRMVKDDVAAMSKLLNKLRSRLINYRRDKSTSRLSKTEQALVLEVEDIIIASLSEQAAKKRLDARERMEAKARVAEATQQQQKESVTAAPPAPTETQREVAAATI